MAANQNSAQTLAAHLVAQTTASVQLLEQLGVITAADGAAIRERLPSQYATFPSLAAPSSPANSGVAAMAGQMNNLAVSPAPAPAAAATPALPARQATAPAPAPSQPTARALWDYSGTEADDLQFRQGDTIVIDEEVNDQWYRGRIMVNGAPGAKSGLFPSNYVEKIAAESSSYGAAPYGTSSYAASTNSYYNNQNEKASYGTQPPYQPPASAPPAPEQQTIVVQEEKKNKFGKYGNNLANSAVSGVGFGAGSAIGGGIIRAIF